jgi:hypothetical protein
MYFFIFVGSRFNTYLNTKETQLQKTLIINTFAPIYIVNFSSQQKTIIQKHFKV